MTSSILEKFYNNEQNNYHEIGIDEAGRGPLFGRVYSAAVILPRNDFNFSAMKDSKKFHSIKKINEVAEYIQQNAISYGIGFEDEKTIDRVNILQATQMAMHKAISEAKSKINSETKYLLLVDGNYFRPQIKMDPNTGTMVHEEYQCIEGGDNKYCSIAAASILAKVYRDNYIKELCKNDESLSEKYDLDKNKGYGTKKHMDGLKKYGSTDMHRLSFAPCKKTNRT